MPASATAAIIKEDQFRNIADKTKAGCPISKLLKADISLDAHLEN